MTSFKVIKQKSIESSRKGEFTFFDEKEIVGKINSLKLEEKPIVLFMPSDNYWVLLTDQSIIFKRESQIKKIMYSKLKNKECYYHMYKNYEFNKKEILCDHIILNRKSIFAKSVILPIEILSVFSFSQPINLMVSNKKHYA